MYNVERKKLAINAIVLALVFCLTARPTLNAAHARAAAVANPDSLAETLFAYAKETAEALHRRPLEERTQSDYRRALDAYGQVVRLNTDHYFSAESLYRKAELHREMADATGDAALYQEAIASFRQVIAEHPKSVFVGDALSNIAEIYEESLQDLDGAAAAYRELIEYFPSSVLAREARAVLARFEAQLNHRAVDVVGFSQGGGDESISQPRLSNVRNYSGPDYTRLVIDLSDETRHSESRVSPNRLTILFPDAAISSSLYGRRFIVGEASLLKRITISRGAAASVASNAGLQLDIELRSASDYSLFRLSDPERIVIDLHAEDTVRKSSAAAAPSHVAERDRADATAISGSKAPSSGDAAGGKEPKPRRSGGGDNSPIFGLPTITDPILPLSATDSRTAGASGAAPAQASTQSSGPSPAPAGLPPGVTAAVESKPAAGAPVKCIVIDPGHGGHDTGTISSGGLYEKDLVLDVARRLRAYIKHSYPDIEVVMTRDADRFVALEERTAIANSRRADLFISVHANSSESRAASGVETYFLSPDRAPAEDLQAAARENARLASEKQTDKAHAAPSVVTTVTVGNRVAQSRELARYIQAGLVRGIGAASPRTALNRGVKHAPFVVLLGAAMPSVLAEISFVSNPRDEALLQTSQFRERVAASLFAGLNAYLKKK